MALSAAAPIRRTVSGPLSGVRERSVGSFVETLKTSVIDASDISSAFANLNTPEELRDMERGMR